jgi:hypothetical protein
MRSLAEQVEMTVAEGVRERKFVNLRQHLKSGLYRIQRTTLLTALIRFREGLRVWLSR